MAFIDFLRRIDLAITATPSKEEKQAHAEALASFQDAFDIKVGVPFVRPDGETITFTSKGALVGGAIRGGLREQTAALKRATLLKARVAHPSTGFNASQQALFNEMIDFIIFQ